MEGSIITPKGLRYTGSTMNWNPVNGTITYTSGLVYTGEITDWKWHGLGRLDYPPRHALSGKPFSAVYYEGSFEECKFEGDGEMKWRNGKGEACCYETGSLLMKGLVDSRTEE